MRTVATSELDALVRREHSNPHSVLGAHPYNNGVVIRALRPAASTVTVLVDGKPRAELETLVHREHSNPHVVLGAHPYNRGVVIRALRPAACAVTALPEGKPSVELQQIHPGGVFEGVIEDAELPLRYRLEVDYGDAGKFTIDDPYAFLPTIGELDQHLISEGRHEPRWTS